MHDPDQTTPTVPPPPRLLAAGDGALVVEFGDAIDAAVNLRVIALDAALSRIRPEGVIECVPTYRSLLVVFDPLTIAPPRLEALLLGLLERSEAAPGPVRRWTVPVCYGGEHGIDLADLCARHGLTAEDVIALHSAPDYRVYMIGFAPGFLYLGGLDERLHTDRRPDPRLKTPPGSIAIGGRQTALFPPIALPSGWHLIGRTPVRSYDPRRTDTPFPIAPGDRIRFEAVAAGEYDRLCRAAEAGETVAVLEVIDG